jgi:hypothetical protein
MANDMTQGWKKHNGSHECYELPSSLIEVETYSSQGNYVVKASQLDWQYVKFYRVVEQENKDAV